MPHGRARHGDAVRREERVAGLNAVLALGYGRFAIVVGNPEDRESPIVGLLSSEALLNYRVGLDYAHSVVYFDLGRTFKSPEVEIDNGVSVVESDAVVEQGL